MHRQEEGVVVRSEAEKDEAEERSLPQIERPARLFASELMEKTVLSIRSQAGKIDQGERNLVRRIDDLDRFAVPHLEAGAKRLVAADDLGDGSPEAGRVEGSAQADRGEQAEAGRARFELLQEPEALLGEGERRRPGVGSRLDRVVSEKLGLAVPELLEEKLAGGRHSAIAPAAASGLP
jgi:hypothetical protein